MASRRSSRLSALNAGSLNDHLPTVDHVEPLKKSRKRKGEQLQDTIGRENGKDSAPSTPKRKVARNLIAPSTPTPAAVNALATASRPLETRAKTPEPPVDRVADPYTTNAPLISPETSRLITNKAVADLSPSKPSKPRLTTGGILDQALKHLIETEPKLKAVVEKHHCHIFSPEGLAEVIDPFVSLASSIIGQQVSNFEIASFCLQQ